MNAAAGQVAADCLALQVDNLTKVYDDGNVQALDNLNLQVEQGSFFALLGSNGAGKSTAIGVVAGLVRKTSGKVRIFGLDIDTHHDKGRQMLGLVPQEFNFDQFGKVKDIVRYSGGYFGLPWRQATARVKTCLEQLDLWDKRDEVARNLSGGMKRRLMIARSLIHEPSLLILDEPTAGVDVHMRHATWDFLREINASGTTIVLTTHYLDEARTLCDQLAIIDNGRIVESGTMQDVLHAVRSRVLILEPTRPLQECPKLPTGYTGSIVEGGDLRIAFKYDEDHSLSALMAALSKQSISIVAVHEETNRLEEVFLSRVRGE